MIFRLPMAIDAAAERDPERDAIRFSGASLTYGELADRTDRLARVLHERGVRRGDRVGIYATKGLHSAVAIHGIMKAGAAYVPLDPGAPVGRAALITRDCGIQHLVSHPAQAASVRDLLAEGAELRTVVGVESADAPDGVALPWTEVEASPPLPRLEGLSELDLAYILYTSGSTGVPKGVVHTHRSALAFAKVAAKTYGFEPSDRVTNHAPLHFDLSTLDYFATAIAGGTTVVIPEGHTKLPASLSKLLQDEAVTVLYAVPLALAHLLLYGALEKRDLTRLRWVLFGGEPFPPKHLRELMMHLPGARFANIYGPTEVNGVTHWPLRPIPEGSEAAIPIGSAYENVDLRIVDGSGEPVMQGETGEMWVHSPTMMQGYWGRPDLDEAAFAVCTDAQGERRYHRTGDLAYEDEEGILHFLGRKDRQIKTRGYRVELDEVESVLTLHADVETAAVFGVPDGHGSTAIEAAVVLKPGTGATGADLMSHAAGTLPPYALPERLDIVEALPRTSTDKISRVRLREQAIARRESKNPQGEA